MHDLTEKRIIEMIKRRKNWIGASHIKKNTWKGARSNGEGMDRATHNGTNS